MKFQPDRVEGVNLIASYTHQAVNVSGQTWSESFLLPVRGAPVPWQCAAFEELTAAHFERVAELQPELVIFGSGLRLRFLRPELLRPLIECGIGIETMDTAAACRTYNVLASEGRHVVAALLLQAS